MSRRTTTLRLPSGAEVQFTPLSERRILAITHLANGDPVKFNHLLVRHAIKAGGKHPAESQLLLMAAKDVFAITRQLEAEHKRGAINDLTRNISASIGRNAIEAADGNEAYADRPRTTEERFNALTPRQQRRVARMYAVIAAYYIPEVNTVPPKMAAMLKLDAYTRMHALTIDADNALDTTTVDGLINYVTCKPKKKKKKVNP